MSRDISKDMFDFNSNKQEFGRMIQDKLNNLKFILIVVDSKVPDGTERCVSLVGNLNESATEKVLESAIRRICTR